MSAHVLGVTTATVAVLSTTTRSHIKLKTISSALNCECLSSLLIFDSYDQLVPRVEGTRRRIEGMQSGGGWEENGKFREMASGGQGPPKVSYSSLFILLSQGPALGTALKTQAETEY